MNRFLKAALPTGLAVTLSIVSALSVQGAKPASGAGKTLPIPAVIDFISISGAGMTNDGKGSYSDGQQNVSAFFFEGTRNAGLYTQADPGVAATRTLALNLSNPIGIPGVSPFSGPSGVINAQINQNMLDDISGQLTCCSANGLKTIQFGDPARYASVSLFFPDPQGRNLQWKMVWGPATASCLETSVNLTNDIWQVNTGNGASLIPGCAGQSGLPHGSDVATVYSASTTSRKVTWSVQGYYHVPFQFTIRVQ